MRASIQLNKRRERTMQPASRRSFSQQLARPKTKGRPIEYMIRLFTAFCKTILENLSDEMIFNDETDKYQHHNERCPNCGSTGNLAPYCSYSRNCVYHKDGKNIDARVSPLRFKCDSCGKTHALLPDVLIPYSPYSLSFILTVMIAYFQRDTTVVNICERFEIAVSTIYEWKKRLLLHKELMLGLLISRKTPALAFLQGLLNSKSISDSLHRFFRKYDFSFLQNHSSITTKIYPP